ncbi:MAG: protein phosphatase 2C domain-containing protein [bacterium]|nr:protein phosphatase 2C domain-containing protein [bacterium]
MRDQFEIAGGSVAGRDHVAAGRNNQDAFAWHQDDRCTIAVVADGCSEGPHSEVGAQLGVKTLVRALACVPSEEMTAATQPSSIGGRWPFLNRAHDAVLEAVHAAAVAMSDNLDRSRSRAEIIREYFLFTVVGVIITAEQTFIFSIGDGCYAVNSSVQRLGPFPNNAPPYIGYGLIAPTVTANVVFASFMNFQAERRLTTEVDSLLLGTDGVDDLIAVADRKLPGKDEPVGPLAQFWADDRFFRNPDMVRRRLTLINRESVRAEHGGLVRESGLLRDDTTLITIRRRKEG